MAFLYRVAIDQSKCICCGGCFDHFPELQKRLNKDMTADLTGPEFSLFKSKIDWAKNLCPEDAFKFVVVQ